MNRRICITLAILLSILVKAQTTSFINYGMDQGLVQNQIQSITQDNEGNLFVGTIAGLSKYNGTQWTSYTKNTTFHTFSLPKESKDSIANSILSKDIKKKITAASYEAAAVSAAIDMENKAIEVYSERAKNATDPNEKALFKMLSDWERTHHKILYELDKQLKEEIWFDNSFWPY